MATGFGLSLDHLQATILK